MKKIVPILIFILILGLGITIFINKYLSRSDPYTDYPTVVSEYAGVLDKQRIDSILNSYPNIQIGMSDKEILAILGEPDNNQILMAKESNEVIGRPWTYYIYKVDEDLVNINDKYIEINFNSKNQVESIKLHNLDEIVN